MRTKTYFIQTFGCAMNEYDSERMAAAAESRGFIPCEAASCADLIIYNTCSVREKPQTKISSYLGRARIYKERKPDIIVGITGCVAQQEGEALLERFKTVDFVAGTDAVSRMGDIIDKALSGIRFADTGETSKVFSIGEFNRRPSVTAGVTVMKGCENFCSYCIVPFVRGKELSRKPDEILKEVERLADKGVREICFLGQNVNSYGRDLSCETDFSDLLKMADRIPSINRIRFMTSHPKDFSEKMIHTIAECEKVCRYIHLPLQSGSDRILKAMNRKYTLKEYMDKLDLARKIMPDAGFSSDFITGFPGETEEDFNDTLKAVGYAEYEHIFAFNYSPRPGTAAEQMGDTVPDEVKNERLTRLFELHGRISDARLPGFVGTETEVLVTERKEAGVFTGCNTCGRNVNFISDTDMEPGELARVKITEARRGGFFGILV